MFEPSLKTDISSPCYPLQRLPFGVPWSIVVLQLRVFFPKAFEKGPHTGLFGSCRPKRARAHPMGRDERVKRSERWALEGPDIFGGPRCTVAAGRAGASYSATRSRERPILRVRSAGATATP